MVFWTVCATLRPFDGEELIAEPAVLPAPAVRRSQPPAGSANVARPTGTHTTAHWMSLVCKCAGGSVFLFDRRAVRFFRKDGHSWRKKADGKTVRETHEKLKVGAAVKRVSILLLLMTS